MKSLNEDILNYLIGLKLNNHVSPRTEQEKIKMIKCGKTWIDNNKGKKIDLY